MQSTIKIYPPAPKGGPTTDAGKAIASKNSSTHGLSGSQTVLSYEAGQAFDEMLSKYTADLQPQTEHEGFAVRQMADARWKLERLSRIEAAMFEEMLSPGQTSTPDHSIAAALLGKQGDALGKLQRYRESLERSYYRAHKEFQTSRKNRQVDPEKELDRALKAFVNTPVPLTREIVPTKTNSPAAPSTRIFQNELPDPATSAAPAPHPAAFRKAG